jgi:hypothetical protein
MDRYYEIPEGDGLRRMIRTPLEEAIYDVLGGMVPAAEQLGVKRQHVHYWLSTKRLRDRDIAVRLAEATEKVGRPVPVTELLDLEPWRGPERHGSDPTKKGKLGPKVRRLRSGHATATLPVGGGAEVQAKGKHTCPTCHRTACTSFSNCPELLAQAA